MVPRSVVIAGLFLAAAAIPQICHGPTELRLSDQARLSPIPTQVRQKIDAPPAPGRHQPESDLDIPYESVDFSFENIEELKNYGITTLELPGTSPIRLTMERLTHVGGITSMALRSNGLRSTLSHRGNQFYLSLATPFGGYRIEGNSDESRLIYNQTLNQRTITTDADYRHAH